MAIDLKKIKPNIPQVALESYSYLFAGTPKSGKTTLFANLIEKYYGDINNGILLATEKGYQALRVNAVDINDWSDFEEAIEQLVEEKDELPFKIVGIDTCDNLWSYSQTETIKEWNLANPSKRTKDIAGVGAKGKSDQGFGIGYQIAKEKIKTNVDKLMKAGYGVIFITHSKDKEIEEKSGLKYDQLVVSLPQSAREVFVNLADFICFITIEKEKIDNQLETKRYIYFRTDGYVEAGSRFKNVPEKIEYDVDGFINVFKNAVASEFDDSVDLKEIEEQQKEEKERQIEESKNNMTLEKVVKNIKSLAKQKQSNGISTKEINKVIGNLKYNSIQEAQNIYEKLSLL